jgi:hypothetical protein
VHYRQQEQEKEGKGRAPETETEDPQSTVKRPWCFVFLFVFVCMCNYPHWYMHFQPSNTVVSRQRQQAGRQVKSPSPCIMLIMTMPPHRPSTVTHHARWLGESAWALAAVSASVAGRLPWIGMLGRETVKCKDRCFHGALGGILKLHLWGGEKITSAEGQRKRGITFAW